MRPNSAKRVNSKSHIKTSLIEYLEPRQLFSGWTTVGSDPSQDEVISMAADHSGNVYALDDWNGLIRKSSDAGATWNNIAIAPASTSYHSLTTDGAGDLFVAAQGVGSDGKAGHWQILEMPVGQSSFAVIDEAGSGDCTRLAVDGNGDIFALGDLTITTTTTSRGNKTTTTSTNYHTIRARLAGQNVFSTVQVSTSMDFNGVTAIDAGASAGVYVVGAANGTWTVLKSSNHGQTWSQVDQYQIATAAGATNYNVAWAVVGDSSGNVFVAGEARKSTVSGYTKRGVAIYSSQSHVIVRKSSNGGASWSPDNDYTLSSTGDAYFGAMGTDQAGTVYVAATAYDSSNQPHGIVRSNANGGWSTVDNFTGADGTGAWYYSFTADSNGNLYVGGQDSNWWLIRESSSSTATQMLASN